MIEAVMIWNEPNNKSHWDLELDPDFALFADMATGNSDETDVLEATCCNGSNLFVSDGAKQEAVQKLLEGD